MKKHLLLFTFSFILGLGVLFGQDIDLTSLPGDIYASAQNLPNEGVAKAFDDDTLTKWLAFDSVAWVQYHFDSLAQYVVTSYTFVSANDAPERDPSMWHLMASNDLVTWDTLDSKTGESFASRYDTNAYAISNAVAYAFYRFELENTSGDIFQIAEIELNGSSTSAGKVSAIDLTNIPGGIVQAQAENAPGEAAIKIVDNDTLTKWLAFKDSLWIQFGFKGGQKYVVTDYTITSANDAEERDPKNWVFSGSNDGVTWTEIESRTDEEFAARFQKNSYSTNNTTAYGLYRFVIKNNSGGLVQVAEMELIGDGVVQDTTQYPYKYLVIPGRIEAEHFDVGGEGLAYHDNDGGGDHKARPGEAVGTGETGDVEGGKYNVGWTGTGEWLEYTLQSVTPGTYDVSVRIAAPTGGATNYVKHIKGTSVGDTVTLAEFDVPSTTGWQSYETVVIKDVAVTAGTINILRFEFGAGTETGNLNWFEINEPRISGYTASNSLIFDGENDFVDIGNDTTLKITGSEITLEAWINMSAWRDEVWQGCILNKEHGEWLKDYGYMLRCGKNGTLNFNLGSGSWNEINSKQEALALNKWQHVAGTYDGTTMKLYIDGLLVVSEDKDFSIGNAAAESVYIGSMQNDPGRSVNGKIDEVRIWNVARTKEELFNNATVALNGDETGLVAYYDMEEGCGQDLLDMAGENDGILGSTDSLDNNDPLWADACTDADGDGWADDEDNCPDTWNPDQADADDDGKGDVCDTDDIEELMSQNLVVYPNPASGIVYILNTQATNIHVYDITGSLVKVALNTTSIDVSELNAGMYIIKVNDQLQKLMIK